MTYHVYIVEPPTLLDDLLEDSSRLYHGRCAVIQRVFHERWMETLGAGIGREQIENADDAPAAVEARASRRLLPVRNALCVGSRAMIREQEAERAARDGAIRSYVASLVKRPQTAAA
jgi:hypothetical protein